MTSCHLIWVMIKNIQHKKSNYFYWLILYLLLRSGLDLHTKSTNENCNRILKFNTKLFHPISYFINLMDNYINLPLHINYCYSESSEKLIFV